MGIVPTHTRGNYCLPDVIEMLPELGCYCTSIAKSGGLLHGYCQNGGVSAGDIAEMGVFLPM
jgi:hypothetical protein